MNHLKVDAVIFVLHFGCIGCDFRPRSRL